MTNWLGLDYGKRFIGAAIGNDLTLTADALNSLPASKGVPHWPTIDQLVEAWHPRGFILGYPLNMDGSQQNMSRYVLKFKHNLEARYQKPCYLVDERLSSRAAQQLLGKKHNQDQLNALAAQIILQHWLDEGMPTENQFPE